MSILRAWQRGQALVEALVLLPLLILSCMAVAWLGQLLFIAQAAGVASRSAAMVAAAGGGIPARSGALVLARSSVDAEDSRLAPRLAEWLGADVRQVSVTAHAEVAGAGLWGALRIERRTRVAAGAGNADGDEDVSRRIGAAAISWAQTAQRSLSLAREISGQVMVADRPWSRPALSQDWLSSWADVAPEQGLARNGRATR